MDMILIISIFLVFITALVGSYLQHKKRDRVLVELQGFQVITQLVDGQKIWGEMDVFPNGLELKYPRPYQNHHGHHVTSYIMFQDGMAEIEGLFRVHGELTQDNQQRREKEIEKTRNPGMVRVLSRRTQNFMNTFRDAINESMGMLLTRMKGTSSLSVFKTQDERLRKIGSNALVAAGNSFDPILERHLGKPVVVELQTESGKVEYAGLLREYSQSWLSLFDCTISLQNRFLLSDDLRLSLQRDMDFIIHVSEEANSQLLLKLSIHCYSEQGIFCQSVEGKDYRFELNQQLAQGESESWELTAIPQELWQAFDRQMLPCQIRLIAPERMDRVENVGSVNSAQRMCLPNVHLLLANTCAADVFIPRGLAVMRHSGVQAAAT